MKRRDKSVQSLSRETMPLLLLRCFPSIIHFFRIEIDLIYACHSSILNRFLKYLTIPSKVQTVKKVFRCQILTSITICSMKGKEIRVVRGRGLISYVKMQRRLLSSS